MGALLSMARPHYVIGSCEQDLPTLHHEMAHGLYATNPAYKSDVRACLAQLSADCCAVMRQKLLDFGYVDDAEIIADEFHAYTVDGSGLGGGSGASEVQSQLQAIFRSYAGVAAAREGVASDS